MNLSHYARTMEQLRKRWYKSPVWVTQKENLSRSFKPLLNNLSFVNKMKLNILYRNIQTNVSLAIGHGIVLEDLRVQNQL